MALMVGCVIAALAFAALAFAIAMAVGAEKARAAHGCRHRWTTIPPRTVDFMTVHGIRLPDAYVGSTVAPWCVKCRAKKGEVRTIQAADGHIIRVREPVKRDPLSTLTVEWLADPRPAWETVEAFERDVERVLHGDTTRQASRMPLRSPPRPSDSRMARPDVDRIDHSLCPACGGHMVSAKSLNPSREGQVNTCARGHYWHVWPDDARSALRPLPDPLTQVPF